MENNCKVSDFHARGSSTKTVTRAGRHWYHKGWQSLALDWGRQTFRGFWEWFSALRASYTSVYFTGSSSCGLDLCTFRHVCCPYVQRYSSKHIQSKTKLLYKKGGAHTKPDELMGDGLTNSETESSPIGWSEHGKSCWVGRSQACSFLNKGQSYPKWACLLSSCI